MNFHSPTLFDKEPIKYSLINSLYIFSEIVYNLYNIQESVVITNYLYDVTQKFLRYYESIPVLNGKTELVRQSRPAPLSLTKTILSNGIKTIGINSAKKL